jgi:hypothetical protein
MYSFDFVELLRIGISALRPYLRLSLACKRLCYQDEGESRREELQGPVSLYCKNAIPRPEWKFTFDVRMLLQHSL